MILKKPDFILILDTHPVEDGRIQKHIRFLLDNNYPLFHIHITPYQSDSGLSDGEYSILGEKSYNINLKWKMNKKGLRLLNYLSYFHPALEKKILAVIEHWGIISSSHGIIHIHDPVLLPLGKKIRAHYFTRCVIVYDRHEIYEGMKRFAGISGYRLFELISTDSIHSVVKVSDEFENSVKKMFPKSNHITVQNFPMKSQINQKTVKEKIDSFLSSPQIKCIYIGSLRNNLDRDIDLLLLIADQILTNYSSVKFIIGGPCEDSAISRKLNYLQSKFPSRFIFLGVVPFNQVIPLTQEAHLGFLFLKNQPINDIRSPNKIFDYLSCGVIPVIRGNFDFTDKILSCSLIFSYEDKNEKIFGAVDTLIKNPERMIALMKKANTQGQQFTWEHVASRYLSLYEVLLASNNKISK